MNITKIDKSNAMCAFLPRSLAPTTLGYQGSALPIGGAAHTSVGDVSNRMWTDRRIYSSRTPMI